MKHKLEGNVKFALTKKNLKPEDFTVEAKIGGGVEVVHVTFKNPAHINEYREHLKQLAERDGFIIELKVAA